MLVPVQGKKKEHSFSILLLLLRLLINMFDVYRFFFKTPDVAIIGCVFLLISHFFITADAASFFPFLFFFRDFFLLSLPGMLAAFFS